MKSSDVVAGSSRVHCCFLLELKVAFLTSVNPFFMHASGMMPQSESFDRKKGGHHLLLVHMNIDQKEKSDKLTHKGKITLNDHKTHTKHLQPGKPGQILIIAKFSFTD